MNSFNNEPVDDVITLGEIVGDSTELKVGVATFGVGIDVIILGVAIII